ncbi:hypothetical protein [Nonomuraea sp. NPDC049129]|uniref:hypothetical protein n=1 Tax=Nonomuraea sp. NPDC049129 TaxID=3155272 RepID=UPI0033E85708
MTITEKDRQDYPYIIANSLYYGSYEYWTVDQIRLAREHNVPRTTHRIEYIQRRDEVKVWDILDAAPEFKRKIKEEMHFHQLDHSELG